MLRLWLARIEKLAGDRRGSTAVVPVLAESEDDAYRVVLANEFDARVLGVRAMTAAQAAGNYNAPYVDHYAIAEGEKRKTVSQWHDEIVAHDAEQERIRQFNDRQLGLFGGGR